MIGNVVNGFLHAVNVGNLVLQTNNIKRENVRALRFNNDEILSDFLLLIRAESVPNLHDGRMRLRERYNVLRYPFIERLQSNFFFSDCQ